MVTFRATRKNQINTTTCQRVPEICLVERFNSFNHFNRINMKFYCHFKHGLETGDNGRQNDDK